MPRCPPVQFASLQAVEAPTRGDRTRFRSRRKAATEPGEPTKAARPDAEPRAPTKVARPDSGTFRTRQTPQGRSRVRPHRGTPSGEPEGSPAAAGSAARRVLGGRRSERLRASRPAGTIRSPPGRARRLLGAPEPERLTVAGSFGSRRAGRSLGLFLSSGRPRDRYRAGMATSGVSEGQAKRVDAAERRDRVVDAAMRHFAEHGYRGGRVEDIAADVGVAKGTVFLDFGSKEGLFLAAYQRAVSMLPCLARRAGGGHRRGLLGDARLVARAHRGLRGPRSRAQPHRGDRPLRRGHGRATPDRPLHAQRGSVRHARVRRVRRARAARSATTSTRRCSRRRSTGSPSASRTRWSRPISIPG